MVNRFGLSQARMPGVLVLLLVWSVSQATEIIPRVSPPPSQGRWSGEQNQSPGPDSVLRVDLAKKICKRLGIQSAETSSERERVPKGRWQHWEVHFLDLFAAYLSSCGNCRFLPILPRSEESFSVSAVGLEQFEIHHSHSSYRVIC